MKHSASEPEIVSEGRPIREHWSARLPDGSDEGLAGGLLRAAADPPVLSPAELARVAARLRGTERSRPRPLAWQVGVALALILFGSALSAGVSHVLALRDARRMDAPTTAAEPSRDPAKKSDRRRPPAAPAPAASGPADDASTAPASDESVAEPAPVPPPTSLAAPGASVKAPARKTAVARSLAWREDNPPPVGNPPPSALEPSPPAPSEPGSSALAHESRLLARALAELRGSGDARAALALLDEHRRRFGPASPLAPEADATRIEAWLRLGHHAEALALLDVMAPSPAGVGRDLLVTRAELRAEKGRCTAALHDFERVLSGPTRNDLVTERALYGRGACHAKLGESAAARRELERYLARFPEGRFAAAARAALAHAKR